MNRIVLSRARRSAAFALGAFLALLALPASALAASVTTGQATVVRSSTATLNAQVDPTGDPGILDCDFEYVTQVAFDATGFADLSSGGSAPCSGTPPYTAPTAVSAQVEGLDAGEDYRFRVVAVTTSSGTLNGSAESFTTVHGEVGSFGQDGTEASTFVDFGAAFQLGFDAATRRLYVIDAPVQGLWGYEVASPPPPFPQMEGFEGLEPPPSGTVRAVTADDSGTASAGNVYYVGRTTRCFRPAAGPPGAESCPGFEAIELPAESRSAAVDSAGHLWVQSGGSRLEEYSASGGAPLRVVLSAALPDGLDGLGRIAIGADDELYVQSGNGRSVWKLTAASGYTTGEELIPDSGQEWGAIAFDRANNHLYLARVGAIVEYDAAGEQIDEFAAGIGQPRGLAVDPVNHFVYVSDAGSDRIRIFEGGPPIPVLGIDAPSALTNTTATFGGTVNPQGTALSECRFQYVSADAFAADRASGGDGFSDLSSGGEVQCIPDAGSIPADEAEHAVSAAIAGLSPATVYRFRLLAANSAGPTSVLGSFSTTGPPAVETTGSPVPDATSAVLSGRINPRGAVTTYHFEYGAQGPCGPNPCASTPEVALSTDEVQQFIPSGATFKLGFEGEETASLPEEASGAQVQAALEALPSVGAGNINVAGGRSFARSAPTYTVTFGGALGGADVPALIVNSNRLAETPIPGGVGEVVRLVAARAGGLKPETTYHYRLIADNGNPDGAVIGEDMTLTTHPAEPPTNPDFPHPPGNDRAYEQVSIPDSGGNPANFALGFSDDGERAVYQVAGGTPISESGTFFSQLMAERAPGEHPTESWRQVNLTPRSIFEPSAPDWFFFPSADFARFIGYNINALTPTPGQAQNLWRISPPAGPYAQLDSTLSDRSSEFFEASDDAARVIAAVEDGLRFHLYDVSDGTRQLISLLPGEEGVPTCGVSSLDPLNGTSDGVYSYQGFDLGKRRWLSADGGRAIFPSKGNACGGPVQLYLREIDAAQTELVSGPVVSGPECSAAFIRASAEAAFFWTPSRLTEDDSEPVGCGGERDGDVYRYGFAAGELACVTCVVAGRGADVQVQTIGQSALEDVGVSQDGSAVYFRSPNRLVAGSEAPGIYRVEVATGELAYVAPGSATVGDRLGTDSAVSADGQVLVFRSNEPRLDPQGGATNGGLPQYYRYDHDDRSLICVSCPPDGLQPRGEVVGLPDFATGALSSPRTYNGSPLSADGEILAFNTPSALVNADQNTTPAAENPQHGQDVYEWRDGRALLISDGLSGWPGGADLGASAAAPAPVGVSPSGRNVFFFVSAQYTADAPDPYTRLYTARLGGGILFPEQPPPCPLEVCQGTPQGTPADPLLGTNTFSGQGNLKAGKRPRRCPKGKRKVRRGGKVRCVKRKRRGNRERRASR